MTTTAATRYRVVAALVTVTTRQGRAAMLSPSGVGADQFFAGSVLPDDVPEGQIRHLLANGLIEPVPTPTAVSGG